MNDKRYKTYRWQKLRKEILIKYNNECQLCKKQGKVSKGDVVHHIKDSEEYPELMYDADNLICLCRTCHEKLHGRIGNKLSNRFPERW